MNRLLFAGLFAANAVISWGIHLYTEKADGPTLIFFGALGFLILVFTVIAYNSNSLRP